MTGVHDRGGIAVIGVGGEGLVEEDGGEVDWDCRRRRRGGALASAEGRLRLAGMSKVETAVERKEARD